jgi:hypothetical protein
MHSAIIALAFLVILLTPCLVATRSNDAHEE